MAYPSVRSDVSGTETVNTTSWDISYPATISAAAAGRLLTVEQANTTATRTFPSLSSLTKDSGD